MEKIINNYKLNETGISLFRYHKKMIDRPSLKYKIIGLINNKFSLHSFFNSELKDIGNVKKGCQLISLIKKENKEITTREKSIEIINELLNLMEITKENYSEFAYQFYAIIKRNTFQPELIRVKTNFFKIVIENNGSSLYFEEVYWWDYFV